MISRLRIAISAVYALTVILVSAETPSKPRVALVVGNAKYDAAIGSLRNSINDAKAVSKTLRRLGFTVIEEHNVTRDDLLKAVTRFRGQIKDAEVALFYYAGHGANGLYTGELLKHLQTPGLTIEQVFKRTRAGVMAQSAGAQIPAEYSRLVGEDIYLAGAAVTPPARPALPKAGLVRIPTVREINQLAVAGKSQEFIDALRLATATSGPAEIAAAPIDTLLEIAKEDLKQATGPSPKVEAAMKTCQLALEAIRDCLPPGHPSRSGLMAMAHNRLGDCLFLSDKTDAAIKSYNIAIELAPADAYPFYNRGRAYLALGKSAEAKADFTTAADPKFKQPGARKLAMKALSEFP